MEVAKLFVAFLTPLSIAIMGYLIQRALATHARQQKMQERLVDKRLEVYEKIAEDLNRIYCYIMDIGTYKNDTPNTIIEAKRKVDKVMFIYQAIWPVETFKSYTKYIHSAFALFEGGTGGDAKIRTKSSEKEKAVERKGEVWPDEWNDRFNNSRDPEHEKKYQLLIYLMSRDLDFMQTVNQ